MVILSFFFLKMAYINVVYTNMHVFRRKVNLFLKIEMAHTEDCSVLLSRTPDHSIK